MSRDTRREPVSQKFFALLALGVLAVGAAGLSVRADHTGDACCGGYSADSCCGSADTCCGGSYDACCGEEADYDDDCDD